MSPVLSPEPGNDVEMATTTFRLPKAMLNEIDAAADAAGMSRNKAINQFLRFALDKHNEKPAKKK